MKRKSSASIFFILSLLLTLSFKITSPIQAQTTPTLYLSPSSYVATQIGETFELELSVSNVENLWQWCTGITWDPEYLTLIGTPVEANFLSQAGGTFFVAAPAKNGVIPELSCSVFASTGASGSGVLAKLTFKIIKPAVETPINLVNSSMALPAPSGSYDHQPINHHVSNPAATVSLFTGEGVIANPGQPQTVNEDTPVIFNASKTMPLTDDLIFNWNFYDNGPKTLNGMVTNYTFTVPGVYDVTLTVENAAGQTSNATIKITVTDITPPIAVISIEGMSPGQTIEINKAVTFTAHDSYDPENGTIKSYLWDFGQGTNTITLEKCQTSYSKEGTYTVTLTVTDARGNLSATDRIDVKVGSANLGTSLSLPPMVFGITIAITVVVIVGSALWLTAVTPKARQKELRLK